MKIILRRLALAYSIVIVSVGLLIVDLSSSDSGVVDAAPAASCIDDPNLKFKIGKKKRNCKWVAKKPNSRCKKREKKGQKLKVKQLCLAACDRCPMTTPTPNPVSSPTPAPVSNNDNEQTTSGLATFYGGNPSGGACGYNDLPRVSFPKGFSVAIGGDAFNNGYGCGACFEVSCIGTYTNNPSCLCNGGEDSVIVQATDQCPECSSTHFDLNTNAFVNLVGSVDMAGTCGIIETKFRRVSCNFQSNIKIRSKSGTSGHWYVLHIDDVAGYGAIKQIKLREADRRQAGQDEFDIVCDKTNGPSFWICNRPNDRQILASLDVELTDSGGRILRRNNVITNLNGNREFDFGTNFESIDDDDETSPIMTPVTTPTRSPISPPVTTPTNPPVQPPTPVPVSATPTPIPPVTPTTGIGNGNGCCSLDYKNCVVWCGSSYDSCTNCASTDVVWLQNGPPQNNQCVERWGGCDNNSNNNGCCDGLTCRWRDGYGYNGCLPNLNIDPTLAPIPAPPTTTPTHAPTLPKLTTISPAPTPESTLLSTDKAMDAWEVYLGLEYITHSNSENPPNYALVAS
jgi:expansin (peptidoglycan-binding protein)